MDFREFRLTVLKKLKTLDTPLPREGLIRLKTELFHAKVYYNEIGDLYEDLHSKEIKTEAGVIPYLLGLTKNLALDKHLDLVQTRPGSSGG